MYHNHDFEFARFNGKNLLEHLMEQFAPDEMGFTLDTLLGPGRRRDCLPVDRKLSGRLPTFISRI